MPDKVEKLKRSPPFLKVPIFQILWFSLIWRKWCLMAAKDEYAYMQSMVIMALIVGHKAIYSELSTLDCKIFMQMLPPGVVLSSENESICLALRKENLALLSEGKILPCSQENTLMCLALKKENCVKGTFCLALRTQK